MLLGAQLEIYNLMWSLNTLRVALSQEKVECRKHIRKWRTSGYNV